MTAVYGNLMVMAIAVALFVATINQGKKRSSERQQEGPADPITHP